VQPILVKIRDSRVSTGVAGDAGRGVDGETEECTLDSGEEPDDINVVGVSERGN
jgi:hypothetical protein